MQATDPRRHIDSPLMRESLVGQHIGEQTSTEREIRIIPDMNVLSIGGLSILDRGRGAVLPLLDEVVACRAKHKFVVGVGGGARLRHTFHICMDLGLPTGGLAMVAGAVDEQNSRMIWSLLAANKGMSANKENFKELPLWLNEGMIPVMSSMPPYHFWEPPAGRQGIPMNGNDLGMFLFADVMGGRSMIFLKDERGLYTADPKKDPNAKFIPRIGVRELLARKLPELIIEQSCLEAMLNARHIRQVQIINGLEPKLLGRALDGEHVGTIIDADG
ncbi:MAG: uridine kinase [Planctomycetia bacterium]|nr:uridine kinase [Planctomycetia bacterium]